MCSLFIFELVVQYTPIWQYHANTDYQKVLCGLQPRLHTEGDEKPTEAGRHVHVRGLFTVCDFEY